MKKIFLFLIVSAVLAACKDVTPPNEANFEIKGVKFEFADIKGGTFVMGSPQTEPDREKDEAQHKVTLDGFYLGKYEVTQAQWKAVMGEDNNPSSFIADTLPVEQVSWVMVQAFLTKLNALTNKEYRLPTEAEWEYACRAGTTTPFHTGGDISTDQANYDGTFPYNKPRDPNGVNRNKTTKVGKFAPNPWGLYDMHGNVYEWCSDWYGAYPAEDQTNPTGASVGEFKILRGGSYFSMGRDLRSAFRYNFTPTESKYFIGFRIALSKK